MLIGDRMYQLRYKESQNFLRESGLRMQSSWWGISAGVAGGCEVNDEEEEKEEKENERRERYF